MIILKKFSFVFIFFCFFLLGTIVNAENITINKVQILGNSNISEKTIFDYAGIENKKFLIDIEEINNIQKKLYQTTFFQNVEISIENNVLLISVSENPLVEFFIIDGIKYDEIKKKLDQITSIKSNSIFSESVLKKDVVLIKEYLSSLGYLKNRVDYVIKKIDNNRVNVFIDIELNNKFLIKNIFFTGNKIFKSSKLINQISSKEDSLFSFFSSNNIPSVERIEFDTISLKNFYLTEGYYDVQISNSSINIIDDKYVNLFFSVEAGEKFSIANYSIINNKNFLNASDYKFIENILKEIKNVTYNSKVITIIKDKVDNYLFEKGFHAETSTSIQKISKNEIDLILSVFEVESKKVISNIKVIGNDITNEKVIRNNLFFAEGDYLKKSAIEKSKNNLQSINLFKKIEISPLEIKNSNFVDINISIQEKPTGEISSGVGVGSSGSAFTFNLKENNYLGEGILTDVNVEIGTEQVLGNIIISNPDFRNTGNTLKNTTYVKKNTFSNVGYENKVIGVSASSGHEIYKNILIDYGLEINLDSVDVSNDSSALVSSQQGDYLSTIYSYGLTKDLRDKKYETTSGYAIGFSQSFALYPSDIPFISNSIYGSYYKLLADDFQGSIKYRLKSINSYSGDSIKLSNRLFLPENLLRGFANRGVGPIIDGDYIGGNYIMNSTFSTTVPNGLPESWKAQSNLFLDIGNVWGSDIDFVGDNNKIRSSVGIGFTWISPLGPISVTYAEPISKSSSDKVENFNFRIGSSF